MPAEEFFLFHIPSQTNRREQSSLEIPMRRITIRTVITECDLCYILFAEIVSYATRYATDRIGKITSIDRVITIGEYQRIYSMPAIDDLFITRRYFYVIAATLV